MFRVSFLSTSEAITRAVVLQQQELLFYSPTPSVKRKQTKNQPTRKTELALLVFTGKLMFLKTAFCLFFLELGEMRFHVMHLGLDYWIEFCRVRWGQLSLFRKQLSLPKSVKIQFVIVNEGFFFSIFFLFGVLYLLLDSHAYYRGLY